ncbi:hypothetical protein ACIRBX_11955 [Kitasatospora sp. NPDC096147]|uniref:hypothetical protein n=1 Tax=Kitasatospora sp. NPDC096147 TaxID=3364093 RepID=UPI0037F98689
MNKNWEDTVLSSDQAKDLVEKHTAIVAELAIKGAPRGSNSRLNWNRSKANITAMVTLYRQWYGQVVIEDDPDVRHTMLQERGWRDRAGRRHPGRLFLKEALEKARIE